MRCQFCKKEITEDQLRGKRGARCVLCTPKGAMPEKPTKKPKAKKTKEVKKAKVDYPSTITDLNNMKKKELIALAEKLGSSSKGKKDELVKRLAKKLKIKSRR